MALARFDVFADGLFLSYLEMHCPWGGPARIPRELWEWRAAPGPVRITPATERAFRAAAERAATFLPLERKTGGVGYAETVDRLYAVTLSWLERGSGTRAKPPWRFRVTQADGVPLLDVGDEPAPERPGTEPEPNRRALLGAMAVAPGLFSVAPRPVNAGVQGGSGRTLDASSTAPSDPALERIGRVLRHVRALPDAPGSGLRRVEERGLAWVAEGRRRVKRKPQLARWVIEEGRFRSSPQLVERLVTSLDPATTRNCDLARCRFWITRAEAHNHVPYHASLEQAILARIGRFETSGTHWFGPYHTDPSPRLSLLSAALLDLEHHAVALRGRGDVIQAARDPFTFAHEAQLALGPFLFRLCAHGGLGLPPLLCCWAPPEEAGRYRPRTYVWPLPDDAEDALDGLARLDLSA